MKTKLISTVILAFTLVSSPMALAQDLNSNEQPPKENIVRVPVLQNSPTSAKLNADYEADYSDLLEQLKSVDEAYHELNAELESGKLTSERSKELNFLLQAKESGFKATAEELLSSRYTSDKKHLRPEIIAPDTKTKLSTLSTDVVIYPTDDNRYEGNYGSATGTTAGYTHGYNNNLSHSNVLETTGKTTKTATVLHGWEFVPIIAYPATIIPVSEFRFRQVTADYTIGCGWNGASVLEINAQIYDVTSNSLIGNYALTSGSSCYAGGATSVHLTPTVVTFYNFNFTDNHTYRAYLKSSATAYDGVVEGTLAAKEGTKWGYMEVDF
ncbi:hypothetical protein [Cohnella sp. GCM10012308]|uniref:hypothetical protein n=1 Tax=Cohnella sp. GCM10012308 TaxID=3317329 RepID=UPI00361981A4